MFHKPFTYQVLRPMGRGNPGSWMSSRVLEHQAGGGCEVEIPRACGSFQAFLLGKVSVSWVLAVFQVPECRAGRDKGERTGALPIAETRRAPRNKGSEESQRLFRRWGTFLRPIRTAARGCPARARPMAGLAVRGPASELRLVRSAPRWRSHASSSGSPRPFRRSMSPWRRRRR